MLYRKVPQNGDELSILGFGCMRLPVKEDGTIDEERATRQVRYAIDHGVNYVDTACPYHREKASLSLGEPLQMDIEKRSDLLRNFPPGLWKIGKIWIDY
ncbi:Aldo/keto reductase [Methanosarcina barkeri 227]|uniref:Aldo/keto reductase family protein n=2 Tax=Methanosarcina barkeri TaxID=2208 RepID=A0A0G3C7B1_METBA|nr:Aldo/keto reductase [Methanosarcina barkeri 227]AKJ37866.1 aldo/keto reductase family protein [Methanosarcina barkeri CM1]